MEEKDYGYIKIKLDQLLKAKKLSKNTEYDFWLIEQKCKELKSIIIAMGKLQGLILLFWQGFVRLWDVRLKIYWNLCRKKVQKIVLHNLLPLMVVQEV